MLASLAQHQRQHILALEHHASAALYAAYDPVRRDVRARVGVVLSQAADAQAAGEKMGPAWLYQHGLASLATHITSSVNGYAVRAVAIATAGQGQAARTGAADATELLHGALSTLNRYGVGTSFDAMPAGALDKMIGRAGDGKPLTKLFDGFGAEAAANVRSTLQTAIVSGTGPLTVAREVARDLDIPLWRAQVISRTEMLGAYRDAASATYRANADVLDGWIWLAELSAQTCAACLAMHGTVHSLDEDLNSHPNCRCIQMPKTRSFADILAAAGIDTSGLDIPEASTSVQSGADWLADQPAATQQSVLGSKAAYAAYSAGDVGLSDFLGHTSDPEWGPSIYAKSARELGLAS